MHFQIGDRVKVMLPPNETIGANTVRQFQNKVAVVKVVKPYHKKSSMLGYAYTLVGCKSDWGIDLEFCEEWLVPVDDEGAME